MPLANLATVLPQGISSGGGTNAIWRCLKPYRKIKTSHLCKETYVQKLNCYKQNLSRRFLHPSSSPSCWSLEQRTVSQVNFILHPCLSLLTWVLTQLPHASQMPCWCDYKCFSQPLKYLQIKIIRPFKTCRTLDLLGPDLIPFSAGINCANHLLTFDFFS